MAGVGVALLTTPPSQLLLLLALLALLVPFALLSCVICKKRQDKGTYRPSQEEHKQAQSPDLVHPHLPLPLPRVERLI